MGKKKYYAVRQGVKPGIYETWAECEAQTKGFSGAVFKSFGSMAEAEKYMTEEGYVSAENTALKDAPVEQINQQIEDALLGLQEKAVAAFVDGSYNSKEEKSGFGAIIIDDKGIQTSLYKAYTKQFNPDFLELRNVAAELEGVKEAVRWAVAYGKTRIKIYYDYEGIGRWADGSWQAKKDITRQYAAFIKENRSLISIEFCKVSAHSGVEYNEMADQLAKQSLLEKGYKTHDEVSVYIAGFSGDDWQAIVEGINEENKGLKAGNTESVSVAAKEFENRQRLEIADSRNRVAINCYSSGNAYVQGRQTVLFQKMIAAAIEQMKSRQAVIETLNHIYVLSITEEEVEAEFEQLLPHYHGERSGKHYNNLLSAVYHTMWTGYMPDYTALITPVYRLYEDYLHRVSTLILTDKQQAFLDDLYSAYHNIRLPYTRWSVEENDTAAVASMDTAREHIIKGLRLADNYYALDF